MLVSLGLRAGHALVHVRKLVEPFFVRGWLLGLLGIVVLLFRFTRLFVMVVAALMVSTKGTVHTMWTMGRRSVMLAALTMASMASVMKVTHKI